ncbi:helix-turn-helix domain-containing protein [uncultured Oscillibacter sp.]|uniref:helix-turn-helix domain-containing protein n=1 Tax=uncultured Oscillibacter sp. TaxID=876091 RepID=UPI0025D3675D|nr:helix-turn-helix transcriptional regulator [uncultured Oscillibacter sp.]
MPIFETIDILLSYKGISANKMMSDLGFGNSTYTTWKKRGTSPSGDDLSKIADYFHVSVDYLLNRQTPSISSLAPEEQDLIARFRSATPKEKEDVFYILREYKAVTPTMSGESAG